VATVANLALAVAIGITAAAGLALLRGGEVGHELRVSLWAVGALMLLAAVFSFSPSNRRAPDEILGVLSGRRFAARHPDEAGGGLGLTVILTLASLSMFGIAILAR
jgi:hypothetical protein